AGQGNGSSEKRLMFEDLDALAEEVLPLTDTSMASASTNPSSSNQKRRKKPLNPHMPPHEYVVESRAIGVMFYTRRSLSMLSREYVNMNEEGYHRLTLDMRRELETKFEASERFNDYSDYWLHSDWLDKQVVALTTNIVASWCYYTQKKEDESDWTTEDKVLVAKLRMVQGWVQKFSSSRNKKRAPWKETIENAIEAHCVSGTFQWLDSCLKVVPMPDQIAIGAYGTVRKVMITKLESIPSWIFFAGKTLKTKNEKEKRQEIVNEAGGCPVKHPGIIRLAYLHPKTMEGYTLWWNGGSVHSFLAKYNSKVSEALPVDEIEQQQETGLSKVELGWIATYRRNRVNLALSLLVIVGKCHDANYLHNDISSSNVLLHFDPWKGNTVYIGICDWGLSGRVVEKEPSKYGFQTMELLQKVKDLRRFAAPELFYVYGDKGSTTSLEVMQKRHLYTMAADAYATGWIAIKIWNEEWDPNYFTTKNPEQYQNLRLKLASLVKQDVQERASVLDVLDTLRKAPHCWTMPECCYRR
ncbi:MAG: protein kinase, partial [Bacilli bacterium]|nr:protein kinase [Bacilli bacterium]